jgi:hypothetical protein
VIIRGRSTRKIPSRGINRSDLAHPVYHGWEFRNYDVSITSPCRGYCERESSFSLSDLSPIDVLLLLDTVQPVY